MKLCKKCANEIKNSASICPFCGAKIDDNKEITIEEENMYSNDTNEDFARQTFIDNGLIRGPYKKWLSITLCILLGWLGAHKFYEGKYYMGIFYILTLGFWGVGIILDLIKLVSKPKLYYVSIIPFL